MRTYELYLCILLAVQFFMANPRKKVSLITFFISVSIMILLLFIHLIDEGFRWQLIPAYTLSFMYILHSFTLYIYWKNNIPIKPINIFLRVCYLLLTIIGLFLPNLLPANISFQTSGQYSVGTKYALLTDSARKELFNIEKAEYRKLPLQIFYPCTKEGERMTAYWGNAKEMSRAWAESNNYSFLPFIWDHLGYIQTTSIKNAKVREGKYPIIIFSHGYWQSAQFNRFLLEELASHGYVVINLTHEYETCLSVYPDESIKVFSKDNPILRKRFFEDDNEQLSKILKDISLSSDSTEQADLWNKFYEQIPNWMESNYIWVDDIKHVIDEIMDDSLTEFSGIIDKERIGVMGFSFGGGASALATMLDDRISACANLDGYIYGHNLRRNFQTPVLSIFSEGHQRSGEYFLGRAEAPFYSLEIKNTGHTNFNDLAILAEFPLKMLRRIGSSSSPDISYQIHNYVVEFFNQYLRSTKSKILDDPNCFENVIYKKNN